MSKLLKILNQIQDILIYRGPFRIINSTMYVAPISFNLIEVLLKSDGGKRWLLRLNLLFGQI